MSGECDTCGEHCLDCRCDKSGKVGKGVPLVNNGRDWNIEEPELKCKHQWKTMESAPRDRSTILVYHPHRDVITEAYWDDHRWWSLNGFYGMMESSLSHWMPTIERPDEGSK